jgi:Ca2+-dependent lipid-binding protein
MSEVSREKIYGVDASTRQTCLLRVKMLRAIDLSRRDFLGGSGDPYVRILLQHRENRNQTIDVARTRTVPKTLNPLWNQDFVFRVRRTAMSWRSAKSFFAHSRSIQPNID